MNPLPRWRVVAGCLILAALLVAGILFAPLYFHNLDLQNFVAGMTHDGKNRQVPDATLVAQILQKAQQLELPVTANNVQITRSPEGMRIEVRYSVRVNLPLYTVDLHFYPGAGSQ